MTEVFLEELEFYAYHGVSEAEQSVGHRYVASVDLLVQERASETDDVHDTVDYGEVGQLIESVSKETQFKTLERLGSQICEELFATYPTIKEVRLELAKRLPPMPNIAERAGVRIERVRK